ACAGAGEPHEVHRRRDAHDVRDLLVDRGRRRALARRGHLAPRRARLRHRRLPRARGAPEAGEARGRDGMKWLVGFGRFWWDFVIGDDWLAAALVAIAIGVTAAVAHDGVTAWWLMPVAALLVLWLSLRRAIRSA